MLSGKSLVHKRLFWKFQTNIVVIVVERERKSRSNLQNSLRRLPWNLMIWHQDLSLPLGRCLGSQGRRLRDFKGVVDIPNFNNLQPFNKHTDEARPDLKRSYVDDGSRCHAM